jgi:tRNA(Ile)-lysidine synthase
MRAVAAAAAGRPGEVASESGGLRNGSAGLQPSRLDQRAAVARPSGAQPHRSAGVAGTSRSLLDTVQHTIRAHHLLPTEARIIVAVSGGADSMTLLHVLAGLRMRARWTLHVAHLDHRLRADSGEDATFVRALAARLGISVTVGRREVGAICRQQGWSLEDGARRIRYQFLRDVAQRQSAGYVAIGHTADDQAETVLMRLVRGTGLWGLGGMPITRRDGGVWIVRPLLDVRRRDVVAYLQQMDLTARRDPTNEDRRFLRNRIRHELLPLLEQYNPRITDALLQLAEQSRMDEACLEEHVARQWKRLVKARAGQAAGLAISVQRLLHQPTALQRRVLRRAVELMRHEEGQWEFRHWREIERLLRDRPVGTRLDLPGGVALQREPDQVVCQPAAPSAEER